MGLVHASKGIKYPYPPARFMPTHHGTLYAIAMTMPRIGWHVTCMLCNVYAKYNERGNAFDGGMGNPY
jgi:hypothetical protein